MIRTILRRTVCPNKSWSHDQENAPIDLRLAAWAAAVETLQIDLVANAWIDMFTALLEPAPESELRWRGRGPGGNAEIKRAYSALFGRFFGRAILRRDHHCLWLRQFEEGLQLAPGIHARRRQGYGGDLPDWVGWDDQHQRFVIAEAKGSHHKGRWDSGHPPPLGKALAQLGGVEIVDHQGPIQFKTWAVASRWGTSDNGCVPTIITCDPPQDGRVLGRAEAERIRGEMQARWLGDLVERLGRPKLAAQARSGDAATSSETALDLTAVAGREGYAGIAIQDTGILPLVGADRALRALGVIDTSVSLQRKVAIVMVERDVMERSLRRDGARAVEGKSRIDGDGGLSLDGVTYRPSPVGLTFPPDPDIAV